MWSVWKEPNYRTFDGDETSVIKLKAKFLYFLFEWLTVIRNVHASSLVDFNWCTKFHSVILCKSL